MKNPSSASIDTPQVEERGPLLVAGLCERYHFASTARVPAQWRRFVEAAGRIPGQVGTAAYGAMLPVPGWADGFDYLTGVEVAAIDGLPVEFDHADIPGGRYAVFGYRGHASGINAVWEAIWTQWLPTSGYEVTDSPILFEEYGPEFDARTGEGLVRLLVPVQ